MEIKATGDENAEGRSAGKAEQMVTHPSTASGRRLIEASLLAAIEDCAHRGFDVGFSYTPARTTFERVTSADLVVRLDSRNHFVIECKHASSAGQSSVARLFRHWAAATDPDQMRVAAVRQALERSVADNDTPVSRGRRLTLDRVRAVLRRLTTMRAAEAG